MKVFYTERSIYRDSGKKITKVGKGGRLFAKIVFHDVVYLPVYGHYACNFYRPVIDQSDN